MAQGAVPDDSRARAALALASGVPAAQVPGAVGVPGAVVGSLLDDPGFQADVGQVRDDLRARGVAMFAEMLLASDQAFRNIHDALDPDHPSYGAKARLETSRWVAEMVLPAKKLVAEVQVTPAVDPKVVAEWTAALYKLEARYQAEGSIPSLADDPHLLDR